MTTTLPNSVTALGSKMTSFKKISALLVLLLISSLSFGQNAIVGTGFSTGWGGGSCPTGNSNFKYLSLITGASGTGTYGVTTAANGTGNQYMRFGIDWSTTNGQYAINPGTDTAILPNTSYNLNIGCTVSGSQFINVGSTSYNYVFKTFNAGTNPTGTFAFFEVQGAVQSVSSVTQSPVAASVVPSSNVTVTANLSGSLSTGQAVYLRYTNNAFANSTVVQMTGSGSTYTAQIPSSMNGQNKTVAYYVFTSGNSLNSANSGATGVYANGNNADLFTINLNNNGGSNYSYTVANSPVIVNATTGTVGPTGYATFLAATAAINAGTHTGAVTVSIVGATTESTANIPINASGSGSASYTSITVRPAGGAQTLTAATAVGAAFITFNGADNVTFDGLNTNGNSLTISNTTVSATSGSCTLSFIGDATSNTITNCSVLGSSSMAAGTNGGNIFFGAVAVTTGNDNNTISNCNIGPAGANLPTKAIHFGGTTTTTTLNNSGITINNNNIYDYFGAAVASAGIYVTSGTTDINITNNRFYQTASRTQTTGANHAGIYITNTSGNNFAITGNVIGRAVYTSAASASSSSTTVTVGTTDGLAIGMLVNVSAGTGTFAANTYVTAINSGTTFTVSAAPTVALSGATVTGNSTTSISNYPASSYTFVGVSGSILNPIYLSVGTTTATSVQGNTIAGIAMSGAQLGTVSSAPLSCIYVAAGLTTIGDVTGNTVGSMTTTGSITYTSSGTTASDVNGIYNFGSSNWTTSKNNIGGITVGNTGTSLNTNFYGLNCNTSSTATWTVANNTIGGSVSNSISNTSTGTATVVNGIFVQNPITTVTGNTVRNITTAGGTGTGASASMIGISITATSANHTVQQNTVFGLANSNSGASAVQVAGIRFNATTGTNLIARNLVYNLGVATSASSSVNGIAAITGTATYQNNMVRLGYDASGTAIAAGHAFNGIIATGGTNNFYHNSVYIGGTGVTGSTSTNAFSCSTTSARIIRNNIFFNGRSNSAGTGKHYAINESSATGLTINYNDYFANGTGGVLGILTSDRTTLATWQTATAQDVNSVNADPQFIAPTSATPDLHINASVATVIEGSGVNISGITDDYDGQTRSGLTPTDIGADAGNFTPITPTIALSTNSVAAGNLTQNTTVPIYSFGIAVTTASANLTGLSITTTGTYALADVTSFNVYYQTTASWTGSGTLLSTYTNLGGATTITFPSFASQSISNGTTGYIFIAAVVPCSATATRTVIVSAVTASNTTFAAGSPSGTPAAGNTQTVPSLTLNNVTSPAASILNASSSVSWVNPTGCFDEILIVARAGSANDGIPTGNGTAYTGNLAFGSGTALGSGFVVYEGPTTPQTVTTLTNGTTYFYKFFTRSGTTWSSGIEISAIPGLVYCTSTGPASQGSDYFTSVNVTVSGVGITNTASGYSTNGYGNFTAQSVTQVQGGTVNYSLTSPGVADGSSFGIFVDWNQDGDFLDANEQPLLTTSQPVTNPTGTFSVPVGAILGNTRMRVVVKDAIGSVNSCNTTTANSETEDYTFIVTAPVTPTIALSTNTVAAATIAQGTTNNPIYSFAIGVTTSSATLTGLTATTAGSYLSSDVSNLKAWYQTSATFNAGTATLLSTLTTPGVAGSKTFPTFTSQTIASEVTGYIFITADISCTATTTNTISINAITASNTTFALGTPTGSPDTGNAQTITATTANNPGTISVTAPSSSGFTLNYAAASPAPTSYILFFTNGNTLTSIPTLVNGTSYTNSIAYTFGGNSYTCITNSAVSPLPLSGGTSNTQFNYFLYSKIGSTCPIYSSGVTVSTITCPAAPTLPVSSSITSSSATVSWTASAVGGGAATINYVLEVYTDASYTTSILGSPFSVGTSVSQSLTSLNSNTPYYYRIKANNGGMGCDSAYLTGTFTTACGATTSNAGTAQSSCGVTTPVTLAANTPSVGTGAWTVTSGPSTLVSQFSSTTNPTAVFTPAGGTGAYVLTWTITSGGCSSASTVTITVNAAAPTTTGALICQGSTGNLTSTFTGLSVNNNFSMSNVISGGSTYTRSTGGTTYSAGSSVTYSTIRIRPTTTGLYVLNGCASGDTHMQLYATTFTPASPSVNFIAADDDGNNATCTSDPRLTVTLTANQDYILVYTPFSGTGAVTGITITVTPPSGGNMQVVSSATLDWYTVSTGGTKIGSGTTFNPVGVANSGLADTNTAGTTTYYAATSDNTTCRTATTFVINPLPQGSLSANGPFCASGAGQLTWTATAGTGPFTVIYNDGSANRTATGVVSGTPFNIFTTPVTASTTYTLVSVTDSSTTTCARTSGFTGATATITVNPTPTTANAGPDQSVCSTNTITLAANSATSGTGAWSIVSGSGATVTTTSSPTSTFTGTAGATYTLRWTISSGVCTASTDDVVITIFSPLDFVNLQFPGSATICQGSSLTAYGQVYEADVTPGAGQGANIIVEFGYNGTNTNPSTWSNWFTASYNSTVTNNNDEYQYNFTPPTNGTFYYTFRYKQGTCDTWQYGGFSGTGGGTWGGANVSGVLTVNSNAAHTISLSSGSATPALCQNTLLGNTIVYAIGGGATSAGVTGLPSGMSGSFNSGNFTINGTPTASGIFNFTVTTTGNSCASAVTATGTITVSSDLDFVNLQWPPSGSICSTGTYTVYGQVYESGVTNSAGQGSGITVEFGYNGTNSNPSTWTNWSTASYSIDSGNNDEYLYTFTPPSSGTFYYTFRYKQGTCDWKYGGYSAGGGGAWSGSNVSGILTVTASPSAGTLGGSQAVCISDSTTFTSTSSDGSWSSSDTGVASINATTGVVTPVAAGTATMTYTVTGTGGCSNATNTRTVTVNQVTNGGTASSNQIICSGETPSAITLASSVGSVVKWQSSSDAAFTSPTDITNTSTTLTLGSLSATTYYRAVVQSGACSSANSNVVTITVNSLPTVSIASNNSPVCSGAASFSLTGTTDAVVTYNINGGTNATTTLTGGAATISVPNPFASQVLTLVSVANNGCTSSLSDTSTVSVIATTYDGTSWSNGNPDSSKLAIFTGNYTIAADLTACSLRVTNNAVVTVNSNYNVYLNGAITVDSGSSFTMNNNTNLLQSDASAVNTGNIIVKRNTSTIVRLDHTLWSSPVTGQNLFSFSPNTLVNRFYVYNTATNSYVTTGLSNTSLFTPAKGFAVRAPNNQSATTPAVWTGTFTGVPNNGTKTFTLATNAANGYNYNLVGNPYPSAISASNFYAANASKIGGTLYFYAHTLTMNASGIFPTGTNYATWTGLGGAAATAGDGHTPAVAPNGIIQVGQGFIVRATASGDVTFTNAMRVANQQNQFMKAATASAETHRMWLNLKTDTGVDVNQILVGYMDGATQGVDAGLDGLSFGNTGSYLYSKIENDNFVIQARSLPFDVTDEVPLGFNCATAGSYSISLTNTDGLFAADQDILVRDNLTGTDTSIKTVPYTFNSESGVFDTRFRLVYTQALGVPSTNFTENSVIVYKNTDWFHVNTKGIEMKDIMVYDISGRLIYSKKEINATTAVLNGLTTTNQVLILKINSIEDKTVTIKVIN